MFLKATKSIKLNCLVGDDPKQMEAEMRCKYDLLTAKYKDQFVREVISKKGTEQVSTDMLVLYFFLEVSTFITLLLFSDMFFDIVLLHFVTKGALCL